MIESDIIVVVVVGGKGEGSTRASGYFRQIQDATGVHDGGWNRCRKWNRHAEASAALEHLRRDGGVSAARLSLASNRARLGAVSLQVENVRMMVMPGDEDGTVKLSKVRLAGR